jgi:hypothetical protein
MSYLLLFHNHLRESHSLIEGRLILVNTKLNKIIDEYRATSGSPGNQSPDKVSARGKGPIPKCSDVGIDFYTVATSPLNLQSVKGVEGAFFKIDPHEVIIQGARRGDFGIHFDANAPGSAGCIVLITQVGWTAFQKEMKKLSDEGIKQLSLLVSYSR